MNLLMDERSALKTFDSKRIFAWRKRRINA